MEYLELEKVYYKKKNVEDEYNKRSNDYSTIKTNLYISPLIRGEKSKKNYELFLLPLPKLLVLQNQIIENSKKIKEILEEISDFAVRSCILDLAGKEIIQTNEIEGVHSTKKEIYDEINFKKKSKDSQIISSYLDLLSGNYPKIKKFEEIRKIYENLFDQKVLEEEGNALDGKFFRKTPVFIYNNEDKKIHAGINSEEQIEENMKALIEFMNNKEILPLLKSAITHYFIEYIHPFYDGNGRFGRYIYSMYLSKKYDIFTGISLSYAMKMNHKKYLNSFLQVGKEKNYGEITFFVINMLEIIIDGQVSTINLLEDKKTIYTFMKDKIKEMKLEEIQEEILIKISEMYLFSKNIAIKHNDLCDILNISSYKLRKNIDILIENKLLERVRKTPTVYGLGEELYKLID